MKYRKKPIVIEAVQFRGVGHYEANGEPYPDGVCFCPDVDNGDVSPHAHVHTLEGPLNVSVDDWIITGIKGERYPCKPDIFEATYEQTQ